MNGRNTAVALLLLVIAVLLQTTLFIELHPFGAAPNLVLLVIVACCRFLDPEPGVMFGFTAGVLTDLLGDSPLGMWALAMTVVAFVTIRLRQRAEDNPVLRWVGVFGLTVLGETLFVLLNTLFGQQTLSQAGVIRTILLSGAYNTVLGLGVMPGVRVLMRPPRRSWAL